MASLTSADTSHIGPGKYETLSLGELYDLLAEETVKFNKQLLQKYLKYDITDLKITLKDIQEEIKKRRASV